MTTKEKKGTGFFLAILTIVTVVCIIVGCILHLGFGFSRSGNGKMKSDEVAAERFNSISLELDAGSITVETDKPVKDEKMDLKVSIGDVTVNGADCGTSYRT